MKLFLNLDAIIELLHKDQFSIAKEATKVRAV
jgi:hypothetical protein